MANKLDKIVKVNVNSAATILGATDINTLGIVTSETLESERTLKESYSDASSIGDDFGTESNVYRVATAVFGQGKIDKIYVVQVGGSETEVQAMEAVEHKGIHNFIMCGLLEYNASTTKTRLSALQSFAAENNKLIFIETNESVSDVVNIMTANEANDRISVWSQGAATGSLAGSICGYQFGRDSARGSFALKELSGVSGDAITPTDFDTLKEAGANFYTGVGADANAVNTTYAGTTCDKEHFIDTILKEDWVKFNLRSEVFNLLRTANDGYGLDYDDAGISEIGRIISDVLTRAKNNHYIHEDFAIELPTFASISASDKQIRKVSGIVVRVTLMGTIQSVLNIDVNVQV